MRCRIARRMWIDVELASASRETSAAVAAHVSECAACRTWVARERALTADLASLRVAVPFPLDVRARVAARIAGSRLGPSESLSAPRMAWAMSVAIVVGLGLLVGAWTTLPDLSSAGGDARALAAGLVQAFSGLSATLLASLGILARLLSSVSALGRAAADTVRTLEPVAVATVLSCTVMMTAAIAVVLGRDLRRPGWIKESSR